MDLGVKLETIGGTSVTTDFLAQRIAIRRELGAGVFLDATVRGQVANLTGAELAEVANHASRDALVATPYAPTGEAFSAPTGLVVGFDRLPDHRATITVDCTGGTTKERRAALRPRRRVVRRSDLGAAADAFSAAGRLSPEVSTALSRITFRDGGDTCLVQDGQSDWEMLLGLAHHAIFDRTPRPSWWPLVPSGVIDAGMSSRYVIESVSRRAHETWNTLAERRIDGKSLDGTYSTDIGSRAAQRGASTRSLGAMTVIHRWSRRQFDDAGLKQWLQRPLPQFVGGSAVVVAIVDEVYEAGHAGRVWWDTSLEVVSADAAIHHFDRHATPKTWIGEGIVRERDAQGPWMTVELPGFEDNAGANQLRARLSTPYGGHDGNRGLNLIPEKGTRVMVAWSGIPGAPPYVVGNVRSEAAELASPSLRLEDPWILHSVEGHVQEIGKIEVDSPLAIDVKKEIGLQSSGSLELDGDGAQVALKGGKVKAGRA